MYLQYHYNLLHDEPRNQMAAMFIFPFKKESRESTKSPLYKLENPNRKIPSFDRLFESLRSRASVGDEANLIISTTND